MKDAFKTFGLPRTAFVEAQDLQSRYLDLSKLHHPDHGGDPKTASEVNEAYEILKSTDRRLKHLIALQDDPELSQWRTITMSDALMSLFSAVGQITQETKSLLQKHSTANGALAKAILAPSLLKIQQRLEELNDALLGELDQLEKSLQAWDAGDEASKNLHELQKWQAEASYLLRWHGQLKSMLLEVITALL